MAKKKAVKNAKGAKYAVIEEKGKLVYKRSTMYKEALFFGDLNAVQAYIREENEKAKKAEKKEEK